jgi:hypothetical protein
MLVCRDFNDKFVEGFVMYLGRILSNLRKIKYSWLIIVALAVLFAGCGGNSNSISDAGSDANDGGDYNPTYVKPAGYASVTFFIDDTQNRTYQSGDIEWKGSMIYDSITNVIEYDASWAAEVGPYPVLYDDGPIAEGGHEMPGATAGDHIFSVEVYVDSAGLETTYQYGAINEFDNWIWEGPNGEFVVPADSTEQIDADGYYIHAFGTYDLIVTLDTNQLNEGFATFDPAVDRVYLKGSMNSWDRRQLLDNGDSDKGDQAADDGIYTYWHSVNLGIHDGLLYAEQDVQFVFMINELEYKRGDALSDGVSAQTNCSGEWEDVPIFMQAESRGRIKNTTVSICKGGGNVTISSIVPAKGSPEGGDTVAIYGSGFEESATITFDETMATDIEFVDQGQLNCVNPAHEPGSVTVKVSNPSGDFAELVDGFRYVSADQPEILYLQPRMGSIDGGTLVTISGRQFVSGASVTFGGIAATEVTTLDSQTLTCRTPAHSAGKVDVSVINPGVGNPSATYSDGFEYTEGTGPVVQSVVPSVGSTLGQEVVIIHGGGFEAGSLVFFDGLPATIEVVDPPGAISCKTPAHDPGSVDVKVSNPDGKEDTLESGFTYELPSVDWAVLIWPLSMTVMADVESEFVYGQVYEQGVTEESGCSSAIGAQLGYGNFETDPAQDASWVWIDADCNDACSDCGNNDEYLAKLTIAEAGQYNYAYRFTMDGGLSWVYADSGNGTLDGYQMENSGVVTVQGGGDQLTIVSIEPSAATVLGGTELTINGFNFEPEAVVSIDGQALATTYVDANTLTITSLAHTANRVDVSVTNPDQSVATLPGGFSYVLRKTPDLSDGLIDVDSGLDWAADFLVAENSEGSIWSNNAADKMYVAFDDDNLYFGLVAWTNSDDNNTVVVYIDKDYGPATGISNMNELSDNDGQIDNALSSFCNVLDQGYGAEYGLATQNMASVAANEMSTSAGLRGFENPADFYWYNGVVIQTNSQNHVIEASIPWSVLLGGEIPTEGVQMAVFARLTNYSGEYFSDDTLPLDNPDSPDQVNQVVVFEVR